MNDEQLLECGWIATADIGTDPDPDSITHLGSFSSLIVRPHLSLYILPFISSLHIISPDYTLNIPTLHPLSGILAFFQ